MKQEFVASLIVVAVIFLIVFLVTISGSVGGAYPGLLLSMTIGSVAAFVSVIVLILWALPLHLVFRKYGLSNIAWYILLAIIPSFVFVFGFKPFGDDPYDVLFLQALFCSICGSAGAIAFWFITVYRQRA